MTSAAVQTALFRPDGSYLQLPRAGSDCTPELASQAAASILGFRPSSNNPPRAHSAIPASHLPGPYDSAAASRSPPTYTLLPERLAHPERDLQAQQAGQQAQQALQQAQRALLQAQQALQQAQQAAQAGQHAGRLPASPVLLNLSCPFSEAGSLGFGLSRSRNDKPGWTPMLKESPQFELTRRSIQENFDFASQLAMRIDHLSEVEAAKNHAFEVRHYGEIRTGFEGRYGDGSDMMEVPPASEVKAAALARGIARLEAEGKK